MDSSEGYDNTYRQEDEAATLNFMKKKLGFNEKQYKRP